MQEKKLSVQEEQNLTSKLFAKGREWVDSATAHVDTVQDTLTVSANLGSHTSFQSSHTPHSCVYMHTSKSACIYLRFHFSMQQLERHRDELLLWTSKLRGHVDELVMQMSKRRARDLVHRAESHASELQSLAGVFDR